MEFVFLDGNMIERADAKVDIEDRGHQFGDGVYEVIRVYNGKMFTCEEHLKRFKESAEKISIQVPYSLEELKENLETLILQNKLSLGFVYMQLTRGSSPRNHAYPNVNPSLIAYTREMAIPQESMQNGVKALLLEDIRWLRCDIKSLNLLGNVMAKQKAVEAGCFEAIQYRGDVITEGSASNIFIVKNGVLKTHPATNLILNGITRQKLRDICDVNEIAFEEIAFTVEDLWEADEVFLTSTTSEVMPIIEIDGKSVKNGSPGELTRSLQHLLKKEIEKQCG